jgi:RNA polymerase sigma-70 factor (ECF subfamily)
MSVRDDRKAQMAAGRETNAAVERIWRSYHAGLRGFIRSRVGDEALADDILQDVFVKIHAGIGALEDGGRLKGWIYAITRNAVIDHYRARRKLERLPEGLAAPELDADERARRDIEGCLVPLIRRLPDRYQRAVMLSEIEGLTQKRVAERLGLSLSGAKSRVQRGRAMVKEMLQACCRFAFDHRGTMVDYQVKGPGCESCR